MAKQDIKTRKKLRARAKRIIKRLIRRESFTIKKTIKFGSRFFVAQGKWKNKTALFKMTIYPRSYDHLTNEKFSREIQFMRFIGQSSYELVKASLPQLYVSSVGPRCWYIRQYLTGRRQNIAGGNIRFQDSFFTQASLRWITGFLDELHSITPKDLSPELKKLLFPPQNINYLWQFINPYLGLLETFTSVPRVGQQVKKILFNHNRLYATAPRVLAHQEVYAPHIVKQKNGYKLIDWENIGWSPITKDAVTIWMRASSHPSWQKKLYQQIKRSNASYKHFKELWATTVFLQSVFNVIGWHFYTDKKDFHELARFSSVKIKEIINNSFKLYN